MKKFFTKIKDWFKRHKPSKRRLIQIYAALLYNANIKGFIKGDIYKGAVKNVCVPGLNCYSCPGAGAACPLGALQNALASSGTKAPVFVLGIILLFGLILGRTICGFLCPVGLGQELLYKIKTPKLKKSRITRILSYFKYVLLLVLVIAIPIMFGLTQKTGVPAFCKYICPAGTFGGGLGLILHPNNSFSLGSLFTWKFGVMVAMIVASIFIFRFFCRFFCPLGALYGFFNRIALLGVKLDKNKCTDCGLCVNACKMDIKRVGDHECINCGECIAVCPTKAIRWKGSKLFIHENAVEAVPAPSEEKPLGALLGQSVKEPEVVEQDSVISEGVVNAEGGRAEAIAVEAQGNTVSEAPVNDAHAREKKRNFWLQFAAWAAALALLVGAFVYYNFIDKGAAPIKEGAPRPEFSGQIYGEDTTFSISETDGFATVLYFWNKEGGTESVAAIEQSVQAIKADYDITVKSVVVSDVDDERVAALLADEWEGYSTVFVKDNGIREKFTTEQKEGEEPSYELTVILNKRGRMQVVKEGALSYEELYQSTKKQLTGQRVGDICPDFTLDLYAEDGGTFTLSKQRGKVTVVNFWATWCGPCVAELPYFERLQEAYPEIAIIAIHERIETGKPVLPYIQEKGWGKILYAQDKMTGSEGEVYASLVVGSALPNTVVVNEKGIIVYNSSQSLTYELLENIIKPLLTE